MRGLDALRVVDLSTGIAGAYATKLLADAGADVVKVEPPGGDPLRRWTASHVELGDADGALFRFLAAGKRSIVGEPDAPAVAEWISGADLVVESFAPNAFDAESLAGREPGLVVLSITPYGRTGPWRLRPWSEFTIQAQCGSVGTRGLPGGEPFQAGGRIAEWVGGTFAGVAALAAVQRARRTGHGEHVDFSLYECMTIAGTSYLDLTFRLLGVEPAGGTIQSCETPSIEPTKDGWVGFCTNSRQQISDFMLLIERPDLRDDESLTQVAGRMLRVAEWEPIVHAWTRPRTTAEIVEQASLLRIPVAPVLDGSTVPHHEQLAARGVYHRDPTGTFIAPRPAYRISGGIGISGGVGISGGIAVDPEADSAEAWSLRPAPRLGGHADDATWDRRRRDETRAAADPALPLAGIRILDMTAWWAGPSACHMLAALGAEVIHLESATRFDGMRSTGGMAAARFPDWWEASAFYQAANTNKRGLTLDLANPEGLDLCRKLVPLCDGVIENYTPRVMENFGLDWDAIHALAPQTILMRMPAFGLTGPWRDRTGFAQTMEQLSGLAWITGHPDDQPRIQRGPCDPNAGMHAAFAFLVALEERDRLGHGVHVECTMIEGALNAAAEQVIEYSAYGNRLERMGNRSPGAAPQGLYACRPAVEDSVDWLAISVETDAQWRGLVTALGDPTWARDPRLGRAGTRHSRHDEIDAELRSWAAERDRETCVDALLAEGVPAAPVTDPRSASACPQHRARGFFETLTHPVTGENPVPSVPFRYAGVPRWLHSPAPTLGQDNRQVLGELLGLGDDEIAALAARGVIGTRPAGV